MELIEFERNASSSLIVYKLSIAKKTVWNHPKRLDTQRSSLYLCCMCQRENIYWIELPFGNHC